MATNLAQEKLGVTARRPRIGWALGGLSGLALVAVAVAGAAFLSQAPTIGSVAGDSAPPLYTKDEVAVLELVESGVLSRDVLDAEPFRTKQLVAEGLVPVGALDARPAQVPPLYCPKEKALAAAVADGLVPGEVLRGEPFRTKRLINQGLIPRAAATGC